jgi:hypothetical protein
MKALRLFILLCLSTLPIATGNANAAQQDDGVPAAPAPAPIFSAKRIFISNASGEIRLPPGNPDLAYDEFYAAMKSWGRYEIVSSPIDADLVFEIRYTFVIGPTGVTLGNGGSTQDFQFRLVIRDLKSQVVLWAFSESIPPASKQATSRQCFDQAMARIVDDVKRLAVPSIATGAQTK